MKVSDLCRLSVSMKNEDGTDATLSYAQGMQVKFMPTMDVVMQNSLDNSEISRTISKTGTITRHFYSGDVQILFANGNVSNFNSKTKSWI